MIKKLINDIINIIFGDWGLGIATPNPQSPIPNPHYKLYCKLSIPSIVVIPM